MVFNLFKRFTRKSAVSFEETHDYVYSSLYKRLVFSMRATPCQVNQVCEAYISLWSSTPCEARAREVYNALINTARATKKPHPLDWLITEIRFEAAALSSGDRQWAAQSELENSGYASKESALSLYHERIARVL